MQALYAYFKHDGESTLKKSEQELIHSIHKAFDLYHYLFLLLLDVQQYAESRIELARQKRIPTPEDLNPNTRFINNRIFKQLRANQQLLRYIQNSKLSWVNYPELVRGLYHDIIASDVYKEYMAAEEDSYLADKNFLCTLLKTIVAAHEALYQNLEEQSIYWNDEPEFIIGIIIKTLKKMQESDGEDAVLMSLYKNSEDEEFSKRLIRKVVLNHKEYLELIEKFSKNWEVDRIAFLDILLMQMAIAEAIEFKSIPVKVTLNEYLEIAKYYSTAKSSIFLNGILDKAFSQLRTDKKIEKTGRGLIGEL